MKNAINRPARAGLTALVALCGLYAASPVAAAETSSSPSFAFSYDAASLDSAESRKKLNRRLTQEAGAHCNDVYGSRTTLTTVLKCRRDLVGAVTFALNSQDRAMGDSCVAVSMTSMGLRRQVCPAIEYASAMVERPIAQSPEA